jgi:hypothetical protein
MERAARLRAAPLQSQNSVKFCQTGCYDSAHVEHLSVYHRALYALFCRRCLTSAYQNGNQGADRFKGYAPTCHIASLSALCLGSGFLSPFISCPQSALYVQVDYSAYVEIPGTLPGDIRSLRYFRGGPSPSPKEPKIGGSFALSLLLWFYVGSRRISEREQLPGMRSGRRYRKSTHIAVSDVFDMGRRDRYRLTEYGPSAPGR